MKEEILIRYIEGLLSEEESLEIENWYAASEENAKILEQLYFIVQVERAADIKNKANPEQAFTIFRQHIKRKERKKILHKNLHVFQRIAAVLFIPLLLFSGYILLREKVGSIQDITVSANAGMVSSFHLPDGSKVWLNSGSSLTYPSQFSRSTRDVYLTGQGYFDIEKNDHQPFVVSTTDGYAVRVHGTEFNVVAYEDENTIETTLVTGSVELNIGEINQFIKPDQKAIFNKETQQLRVQDIDPILETSWKDGRLIFQEHPMDEVLRTLGRYYNVRFVIEDEDVMNSFLRARFEHDQLPQVMDYLQLAIGIKYRIQKPLIRNNEIVEKSIVYISK